MTPERLQGLAWREYNEARLIQMRSRNAATKTAKDRRPVKVVVIDLGEFRANGLAVG